MNKILTAFGAWMMILSGTIMLFLSIYFSATGEYLKAIYNLVFIITILQIIKVLND